MPDREGAVTPRDGGEHGCSVSELNGNITTSWAANAASDGTPVVVEKPESLKRQRCPLVWPKGANKKEPGDQSAEGEEEKPEPSSPKRLRPNPAFLTGLVSGMKKTNERLLAESAANAACQEITAAAAQGAKAQFDRIPQSEPARFQKLAVSVAAQVNLASCSALLKEIAAHYGFLLTVDGEAEAEGEPLPSEAVKVTEPQSEGDRNTENGASDDEDLPFRPLKPMLVRLAEQQPGDSHPHRKRPSPQSEARSRPPPLPQLAANNRLAGAALSALTGFSIPKTARTPTSASDDNKATKPVPAAAVKPVAVVTEASLAPTTEPRDHHGYAENGESEPSEFSEEENGGEEEEEEEEEPEGSGDFPAHLPQLGQGMRADRFAREFLSRVRGSGLVSTGEEQDLGSLREEDGPFRRESPPQRIAASDRLSNIAAPKAKKRNGLFGAALQNIGK